MAELSYEEIGRRLRDARKAAGLTQQYVAECLGVKHPVVSEMEAGKRKVSALEIAKLAELYGRSPLSFLKSGHDEEVHTDSLSCKALFRAKELTPEDRARLSWLEGFLRDFEQLRAIIEKEGATR